jgi:DNA-binding transcriptional LysR family regulator
VADLNALVIFAKVVDANGFSEAARRLGIPLSTVSRRVAELESQLGLRLLERSTRSLRLTDAGAEVLEHARRSAELSESVDNIVSYQLSNVTGMLRLASLPSISDSLLAPIVGAFQTSYPNVSVRVLVTERPIEHVTEGIDISLWLGALKDSNLVARPILNYRHRLVATPEYLARHGEPTSPDELLAHRLLAFSFGTTERHWTFGSQEKVQQTIAFKPFLQMNDYAGLATALLSHVGIGDLPPIVLPELLASGRLVEAMPNWRFRPMDLALVHLGNRHMPQHVRLFKEFAIQMAPTLFPDLPT